MPRKHPLAECENCPLQKERHAPTSGPADAKVAIVSRSPGKYDVRAKRPFSSTSGDILDHLLGKYGVKRDDILATNVVLCRSDDPPKKAIKCCSARLHSEIKGCSTVIAAGVEAVGTLINAKSLNGTRGYVHKRYANGRTQRVVATFNPAVVVRDDSTFNNLVKDFGLALAPKPTPKLPDVRWTNDIGEAKEWIKTISSQNYDSLTVDIETKGLRADADIVAIGFSHDGAKAVSIGKTPLENSDFFRNYLIPIFERKCSYLYHNGKFDVRNLRWHGANARVDEDTMLLSWALDENSDEEQVHKLEYLLMSELGWPNYEPPTVKKYKADVRRLEKELKFDELRALPVPDELYKYNALDAAGTAQLFPILKQRAIDDNVYEMYKKYLLPASEALVKIELNGINYNTEDALDLLEEEVWPALRTLKAELQLIVGKGDYNPNSPQQNAQLVYDEWHVIHNLRLPKDKERSVDKSVYAEIKAGRFSVGGFPVKIVKEELVGPLGISIEVDREIPIDKIEIKNTAMRWAVPFEDFKKVDKQRSTYIEGMIPVAIHNGDRLYTNFKLHNTVTGRLSSSGPNLQNITRVKPDLPNIRSLFTASDERTLLNCDYSQAELRAIGKMSGDPEFARVFKEGIDFHALVAERFYGSNFTKENRQTAKNINFGVAFLQTPETFQEKHGIPVDEARPFVDWWWQQFPAVREWTNDVARQVRTGEVVSPFGNKRRFPILTKENVNACIREGINFLAQNVAAFLCTYSVVQLCKKLDFDIAAVVLTVHDSILLDVRTEYLPEIAAIAKAQMEAAPMETLSWDFPFKCDLQIGQNWGNLSDYEIG